MTTRYTKMKENIGIERNKVHLPLELHSFEPNTFKVQLKLSYIKESENDKSLKK